MPFVFPIVTKRLAAQARLVVAATASVLLAAVAFKARDERVWGWRYCNDWNQLARFFVLFDGTTRKVRSTMSLCEEYSGSPWSGHGNTACAR